MDAFLTDAEISTLTGRKTKSRQIVALREMGVPFFVNATKHPVVARSVIEGRSEAVRPVKKAWQPQVLKVG